MGTRRKREDPFAHHKRDSVIWNCRHISLQEGLLSKTGQQSDQNEYGEYKSERVYAGNVLLYSKNDLDKQCSIRLDAHVVRLWLGARTAYLSIVFDLPSSARLTETIVSDLRKYTHLLAAR